METREVIFSARRKDFRVDTFRAGGPGGQNQNKIESGVRITHVPTHLSAESREDKSQHRNKRVAFQRLCRLLVQHIEAQLVQAPVPVTEVIRTYNECADRVVDKASGQRFTYYAVVTKNDISGPLEARRHALRQQQGD